jgi:hypothetical protein
MHSVYLGADYFNGRFGFLEGDGTTLAFTKLSGTEYNSTFHYYEETVSILISVYSIIP